MTGRLRVQRRRCATCIFDRSSVLDLRKLLDEVRDPCMDGHFLRPRACHHSADAVCAGFWQAYGNNFGAGQVAQRLGLFDLVDDDTKPFGGE